MIAQNGYNPCEKRVAQMYVAMASGLKKCSEFSR
jgi:hypothetical protein